MRRKKLRRRTTHAFIIHLVAYVGIAVFSYLSNPFTRYSRVQTSIQADLDSTGKLQLLSEEELRVSDNTLYRGFVWLKSAQHMLSTIYFRGGKKSKAKTLETIIDEIHTLRFHPRNPFLISGDHFSSLYPRSLGIFYHSLLDSRTAGDQEEWLHRQRIYLVTTAYALDAYRNPPRTQLSTTIVPLGGKSVSLANFFSPPSDTLYSLLYAIDTMRSNQAHQDIYPAGAREAFPLQTQAAATQLLEEHRAALQLHFQTYLAAVQDDETGLVKENILLSGTKDSTKRQCAFYDNVILWKTKQLAQKLDLSDKDDAKLGELKEKILNTFWSEKIGCFLEDSSDESISNNYYSSDWLIVLMTGFLNPVKPQERQYFERCVAYIQANKLDQPFGLRYQPEPRAHRQHFFIRVFAPSYGATTIWSNWGMEYIKTPAILYQQTKNPRYLEVAQQQLSAYSQNILKYGCYPEVYDTNGKMFKSIFYKSVCLTGWVVSYEQAQEVVGFVQGDLANNSSTTDIIR